MKKYFTFSLDDGVTQDRRIVEIFRSHDFHACTFFLNTGLLGASWEWVGNVCGHPGVSHLRFTEEELKTGIYEGFDVAVHTLHHPSLSAYDDKPEMIIDEVQTDAENIKRIFGVSPVGMSWPGGEGQCTAKTIDVILKNTDIRYSRAVTPTYDFRLPEDFMLWYPTCSFSDQRTLELADEFSALDKDGTYLFYVWGHGYELDFDNSYGKLDTLIKKMTDDKNIICVDNTQFYKLFCEGKL